MATTSRRDDRDGGVLVEFAILLPILVLLLLGGIMFGLATIETVRLERVSGDAALLDELEARAMVATVGTMICWWQGEGAGGCYDDGLSLARTQVVSVGREWVHPAGVFQPTVRVSRPIGVPDEVVDTTDDL